MLARENRLKVADDFRSTMRTGRKAVGDSMVVYFMNNSSSHYPRFGFVVSKSVGSSVERNLVKRRLRSAIRSRLPDFSAGQNLVIRALPSLSGLSWQDLVNQLDDCLKDACRSVNRSDSLIK